jgi:hypothetical protein
VARNQSRFDKVLTVVAEGAAQRLKILTTSTKYHRTYLRIPLPKRAIKLRPRWFPVPGERKAQNVAQVIESVYVSPPRRGFALDTGGAFTGAAS